jgi:hypothetical protein
MPIPASINDLSTTAGSNSPAGSESPSLIDDYLRTYASFIALLRDQTAFAPQTIASAATTDIGTAISNVIYISGTTTITALGTAAAGVIRTVKFLGALTLTHNTTSLILENSANITTAANDSAEFLSLGSGNWLCLRYNRASGMYSRTNIVGTVAQVGGVPTGAIVESGSNANGFYVKCADGALICRGSIAGISTGFVAGGSVFFAGPFAFNPFPVAFIAEPNITYDIISTGGIQWLGSRISPPTTTQPASKYVMSPSSASVTVGISYVAIGRWF